MDGLFDLSERALLVDRLIDEHVDNPAALTDALKRALPDLDDSELIKLLKHGVTRKNLRSLREQGEAMQRAEQDERAKVEVQAIVRVILNNKETITPVLEWIADVVAERIHAKNNH